MPDGTREKPKSVPAKPRARPSAKAVEVAPWRENATLIVAILALLVNGVGAFYVAMQLSQQAQATRDNTLEQIYSRMHDINKMFMEHPELKPYFYEGLDVNDANPLIAELGANPRLVRAQVTPIAETMCDFFAQALIQLRQLPPGAYEGWQNYIKEVYRRSPAMRRYYAENKEWYQYEDAARLFDQVDRELAASKK